MSFSSPEMCSLYHLVTLSPLLVAAYNSLSYYHTFSFQWLLHSHSKLSFRNSMAAATTVKENRTDWYFEWLTERPSKRKITRLLLQLCCCILRNKQDVRLSYITFALAKATLELQGKEIGT